MIAKRRIKKLKKAKQLVADVVSEKAASLHPLTPRSPQPSVPDNVPRITNETIAEHREDVLSGARKYIYPLAHSKHRIIVITTGIIVTTIVAFLIYCGLALYKFYQYNSFLYRVTQVVPFPIAREGGRFIDYENYLFELRHYVHYYENQLQRNFSGADKTQLLQFRKQALDNTLNTAYIRELAEERGVSVSNREVDDRINQVRSQNRLGSNDRVFEDVLRDYWGWSLSDFKRSLKQQVLTEKVTAKLDTAASQKAAKVLARLKAGASFTKLAKRYSEDSRTRSNGGEFPRAITKSDPNVPPQVVDALFNLKKGHYSDVIIASPVLASSGPTLEIVQLIRDEGRAVFGRHISFQLKDINSYIKDLRAKQPPSLYVNF